MEQNPTRIRLGHQLVTARRRKGWRLKDLRHRTDIAPGRLSVIEHGKINATVDTLAQAGEAVGLSLTFVPSDRLQEILVLIGQTLPQSHYSTPVKSVYEDMFIPDPIDEEEEDDPHGRP